MGVRRPVGCYAYRTVTDTDGSAVHNIGSTPTAIMGAIEPITAVAIGVLVFGENFTLRLAFGIVLILTSVLLIICGKSLTPHKITTVINSLGRSIAKTWRWKS